MATTVRTNGLQHAISLGNIEVSSKSKSIATPTRSYDSEDETMTRRKTKPQSVGFFPRGSIYSKGDIREQYCVTDRQLQNSIERPRREGFFGCLSGRGAPQSFLGVCVGRRAPSDENVADYAPFYKYPRYHPHDLMPCDDDLESSYFRRRPASILTTGNVALEAKRYSWMPTDAEAVRLEGPRPICPTEIDDFHRGPYVVGGTSVESYSPKSYLSQSTEQIAGLYRCPAHIGLPAPPPPPVVPVDLATPRTKHVSFARSHTLTSFDEAAALGLRSSVRSLKSARSQERLIGGKKPILTIGTLQDQHQQIPMMGHNPSQNQLQQQQHQQHQQHQQQQQTQLVSFHHHHHPQLIAHHQHLLQQQQQQQPQQPTHHTHQIQPQFQTLAGLPIGSATGGSILGFLVQQQPPPQHQQQQQLQQQQLQQQQLQQQQLQQPPRLLHQHQSSLSPEVVVVEKVKRGGMKTQATQTDQRKRINQNHLNLSLSPRTIHRVKMVSQGAQTNGMLNNRKLTKSLSEMAGGGRPGTTCISGDNLFLMNDKHEMQIDHEQLHRTYSEEPPRSPLICPQPSQIIQGTMSNQHHFYEPPAPPIGALPQSRTSSRTSTDHFPSSSPGGHLSGHSRNHSEDSAMSYRSSMEMPPLLYSSYGPISAPIMGSSRMNGGTQLSGASSTANSINFNQPQFFRKNMDGRSSATKFRNSPIIVNYGEKNILVSQEQQIEPFDYEANSLPRRTCGHHRGHEEFHSYSLPRREHHHPHEVVCRHVTECAELLNGSRSSIQLKRGISRESSTDSNQASFERRRASTMGINIIPKTHTAYRRPSMPVHPFQDIVGGRGLSTETEDENTAKTTTTDNDEGDDEFGRDAEVPMVKKKNVSEDEQEIFIDFKPHISPTPSPRRRKHLQKTLSDGEILIEKNQDNFRDSLLVASASEEDLKGENLEHTKNYYYQNLPIKDEGIFDRKSIPNLLVLPNENDCVTNGIRQKREAFRKRSISLEDQTAEEEPRQLKSAPPSPGDGGTVVSQSAYPSSDSLANDLTIRDHSDGIWNESQVTVLPADLKNGERTEQISNLLTPSAKRKNLILQHQQRSSIDTDALELEEQFSDQSLQNMPLPKLKPASTQTVISPSTSTSSSLLTVPPHQPPQISVIPSVNIETEENEKIQIKTSVTCRRSSRTLSPALPDKRKIEPLVHAVSPQRNPPESPEKHPLSHDQQLPVDSGPKNYTDISECSTNTDEYITCTDNSKRTTGIKTPPTTATSSSSTQVPVSAQSSQTVQEGSSFESASSLYSTRGDGLSEDNPQTDEVPSSNDIPKLTSLISQPTQIFVSNNIPPQLPKSQEIVPATKVSPSHSVTSSSSDSYNLTDSTRKKTLTTHATNTTKIPLSPLRLKNGISSTTNKNIIISKKKSESVSDEEKSEKRYSSSGYYESPHDEEQHRLNAKQRRAKIEEERRRRKSNMKLDIERENLRALTSPIKKPSPQAKQQQPIKSPEEYKSVGLNVIVATSPSKIKRFRPKIKRQTRKSSFTENTITCGVARKTKMIIKSPDLYIESTLQTQRSPSNFKNESNISPKKHQSCNMDTSCPKQSLERRLKAKSIESLRSVSPGSDSVFYSEADLNPEQQVHCLHCGKEVEIITAPSGSQESIPAIKDEEPDIVKPPADFADSPVIAKTSQRLYKKMDKRFRSEERHGDRSRHYRSRQENVRAKSEERGKDQVTRSPPILRPAGSSPCVLPDDENENETEKISLGNFQNGMYTRLTDSDVWIQLDHQTFDRQRDRRGSTDSEKAFYQKYQVILHRLVQRRCTLEMYHRQKQNIFKFIGVTNPTFSLRQKLEEILQLMLVIWARQGQALKIISGKNNEIDKTVVVKSDSGEFGFRIHGSKPVVVAAIEPDTPAETSGLEVGDIIISVNGIQVLDKHHTEVVKIAHAGCETLELEVARTIGVLMNEQQESPSPALYTGYLWRQSGQAKGSPNSKKWVRRWFSLRPDHCLYYYKTDSDNQPVGAVMLTNHTIEHCSTDVGRQYAFKVDSGENIAMYLAADSEETANLWVAIMSHASTQANPWLEFSTRNLKQGPSAIHRPDCFGYLMKMGSRWNGWVKRYCVLKDACIYFYSDGNSKSAFGMACLQGYKVVAMSTNAAGRKNSFEIIPPETKLTHFVFSTESEMDKKRWMSALEYSIDRWIKAK